MKLTDLRDIIVSVGAKTGADVFHYHAKKKTDKYIVWAEDTQSDAGYADNHMTTQVLQGTIDYFTKTEFDPNFNIIQEELNSAELSWRLNSIQYERDTGYVHYEWVWEMVNDGKNEC